MIKRVIAFSCFICTFCLLSSLQSCGENQDTEDSVLPLPFLPNIEEENDVVPIIAHRGCWSGDSLPQNSLAAFRKALDMNILGTEFDVRQTSDGILVINHGATFHNMTISKTTYEQLCQHQLENGESIPLFEDFLKVYTATETFVQLVVELKSCSVDKLLSMLEQYNVNTRVLFITFSKDYINKLVAKGYGPKTYYLAGNITPEAALKAGYGGINYSHAVYQKNPTWIEEAKAKGLKVGVYTVNDIDQIVNYLADSVIVTTDKADKWESFIKRGQD